MNIARSGQKRILERPMTSSGIRVRLGVLLALAISADHSGAFPIEPVPLRVLIEKSDLIMLARVETPKANAPNKPSGNQDTITVSISSLHGESPARLRPLTVLKGTPPSVVEVHFDPNMVCPRPPDFPPNSNVMAFLVSEPASNGFRTVGLDYGAKLLSDREASIYAQYIRDYLQILRETNANKRSPRTTEWLVQCVEDPVTRWEGVAELVDRTSLMGKQIKSEFAPQLSAQQMSRLSNTLFTAELPTNGSLALIPLFIASAKPQVAELYVRYLRVAARIMPPTNSVRSEWWDSFPEPWNVYDTILEAAVFFESPETKALLENDKRTDYFDAAKRTQQVSKALPLLEQAAVRKGFRQGVQ